MESYFSRYYQVGVFGVSSFDFDDIASKGGVLVSPTFPPRKFIVGLMVVSEIMRTRQVY